MTGATESQVMASTGWAAAHLADPRVKFVEVVWGESASFGSAAYERAHIPQAVSWDFAGDLHDAAREDIVDGAGMEALLSRSGIAVDDTVVLYSGVNNLLATFAFWLLRIYGHEKLRLLDGDRQRWLDEKRPVTDRIDTVKATTYRLAEPDFYLRANRQDVLAAVDDGRHLLVDARTAEMYNGLDKAGTARGGHIPGAISYTATRETGPDGTFKPIEELRQIFTGLGITPDKQIITYCVRGGLSTHAWFVLTQLLGYPDVREYDRSWAEWGNRDELPIAQ
jgi:thiosulfate/3-mercaptopyruvate sulfurtransferase